MLIRLHKNATTTPATRLAIQQAAGTEAKLAAQFGVGRLTIRKWRRRSTAHDGSHTPLRLQTTLNAGQEEIVVYLRTHLRLSLDDLLAVVREFIEPAMSRSGLDRLLRRRGINRLPEPEVAPTQVKSFKAYEPGYVHMDVKYLPQMQDERERSYVFVAIDRATRWVFIAIKRHKTAAAKSFLNALHKAAPFRIKTLLTDNGREFTDRAFGKRERDASGQHGFDGLCAALGIEHRLTKLNIFATPPDEVLQELIAADPQPLTYLGFVVFMGLGIALTGFHDGDESQKAVTLFPRGAWDKSVPKMRPFQIPD